MNPEIHRCSIVEFQCNILSRISELRKFFLRFLNWSENENFLITNKMNSYKKPFLSEIFLLLLNIFKLNFNKQSSSTKLCKKVGLIKLVAGMNQLADRMAPCLDCEWIRFSFFRRMQRLEKMPLHKVSNT